MDANTTLAALTAARDQANGKVASIEAEAREAGLALAAAREALAEFERGDGRQSDRAKLEQRFTEAEARVGQPWPTRLDGARRRVRDADRAIADHVRSNLAELLAEVEQDGAAAAARVDAAAQALVDANLACQQVGQQIGALLVKVSPPGPADVSGTRSDEAARAAASFLVSGGEQPPALDRRRAPWNHLLGVEDDVVEDEVVDVAVTAA